MDEHRSEFLLRSVMIRINLCDLWSLFCTHHGGTGTMCDQFSPSELHG